MKIKKILSQHRRDFTAILICEHCETEAFLKNGYDDFNYHNNVIPAMKCKKCNAIADENYRPLAPKYDPGIII